MEEQLPQNEELDVQSTPITFKVKDLEISVFVQGLQVAMKVGDVGTLWLSPDEAITTGKALMQQSRILLKQMAKEKNIAFQSAKRARKKSRRTSKF